MSEMIRPAYEFEVLLPDPYKPFEVKTTLNELGREGWRLAGVHRGLLILERERSGQQIALGEPANREST